MNWYTILCIFCFIVIIVKTVLSWVFGDIDTDIDIDCDGDVDTDLGSIFSLKGVLHFLTGFSTYLTLFSRFVSHGTIVPFDYVVAVLTGVALTFILFWAYKLTTKLDNVPDEIDDFEGRFAIIYNNLGYGEYVIAVNTENGTYYPTAVYIPEHQEEAATLKDGTHVKVGKRNSDGSYLISLYK